MQVTQPNPPQDQQSVLLVEAICKSFGSFQAVDSLRLSVRPGEVLALLGPNGAGKTTTIRMIMGILQPTSGRAQIQGLDCFTQRAQTKRLVGYLPDEPTFYDYLRGDEILRFVGRMHGLDATEIRQRTQPLIERLDLAEAIQEYAANYSKGMKKKLAAVCALIHQPPLLILDEPTNGLDPFATRTMHELIGEHRQSGRSVFFSTHLLDQAQKLCTRAAILHKGKLAAEGDLHQLRRLASAESNLEDVFFAVTSETEGAGEIPADSSQAPTDEEDL
jgi:ABC-2 type transport system ATP-binding protein